MNGRILLIASVTFVIGIGLGFQAAVWFSATERADEAIAFRMAAQQNYEKGNIDESIGLAYQALARDDNLYGAYSLLGDIYSSRNSLELSIRMYETALSKLAAGEARSVVTLTTTQREFEEKRLTQKIAGVRERKSPSSH